MGRIEFLVSAGFNPAAVIVQPVLLGADEPSNTTTADLVRARQTAAIMAASLNCEVIDHCEGPNEGG